MAMYALLWEAVKLPNTVIKRNCDVLSNNRSKYNKPNSRKVDGENDAIPVAHALTCTNQFILISCMPLLN